MGSDRAALVGDPLVSWRGRHGEGLSMLYCCQPHKKTGMGHTPPEWSTMHTEAFKPPRTRPQRTVRGIIRNAACATAFALCLIIVTAYWKTGALFHNADDTEWADLAN